jgi:methylated-DNA-[protein]-cysteine S-methyltransferase
MPVDVTPTKKTPSNRGSRAVSASYSRRWSRSITPQYGAVRIQTGHFRISRQTGGAVRKWRAALDQLRYRDDVMMEHVITRTSGGERGRAARPARRVYKKMGSPIGTLTLVATDLGLAAVLWEIERPDRVRLAIESEEVRHPILTSAECQLQEYFAGGRTAFELPLDVVGTSFQREVWRALRTIPFGETRSYGQIARQIGHPTAVRAVGAANGRNPLSIVTPCHRVIGADGSLTGFAGGLDVKARLLDFERSVLDGGQKKGSSMLF